MDSLECPVPGHILISSDGGQLTASGRSQSLVQQSFEKAGAGGVSGGECCL